MTELPDAPSNPVDRSISRLAPKVRAAALMFRDITGRQPITIIYPEPSTCPKCGDTLWLLSSKADGFPYVHTDYVFKCPMCSETYVIGLSMTKDSGLGLLIWDTNPLAALQHMISLGRKKCTFGHGIMLTTKIFGDWFQEHEGTIKNTIRFQWKCQSCFLTHHETHPRDYPHTVDNDPLTDDEKTIIQKRLRDLGYFED